MPFEYEALVGHLYVVSGRSISANPPGALVEVAPTRAARGREADTFFTLVLPSGDALAPTAFYERMAQTAAERYFESTGSVTAGLRDVYNYLNQNLIEYNQNRKDATYEANIVCAVLRADDLIISRVGSSVAILRHQGNTETLPHDLSNDEALYSAPLGVRPIPDVKMTRHKVANGTRLIMGDANMADFTSDQIKQAMIADEIGMVIVAFKELARLQLSLMAVEFVPPEAPTPPTARAGSSSLEIAESARADAARARATAEVAQLRQERRRKLFGKTGDQVVRRVQGGFAGSAKWLAGVFSFINRTVEHYFGAPEDGKRRWYTMPLATGAAVLLPVVVVAIVVALWLAGAGESAFEQCINEAVQLANAARTDASGSTTNQQTLWLAAMDAAQQCEPLRPGDPTIMGIIRDGQEVIDRNNIIARREPILMEALPGAVLDRIILAGFDIYLLDRTNGLVYQGRIAEDDGLSYSRRPSPIPDIQEGRAVEGFVLDELVDIAFSRVDNTIYALGRNGVLIRCPSSLIQACEADLLLDPERWQNPVAIALYNNRIYILDPAANQVWRYDPSGSSYIFGPQEYFGGRNQDQASITDAVDFTIDTDGVVYVLLSDGTMLRYNGGDRIDFAYGNLPTGQTIDAAQAMFLDDNPIARAIYITNRNNRTIYEVGKTGTFRASYRIFDEALFNTLSGATAAAGLDIIYAISGNSVFALQKKPPQNG